MEEKKERQDKQLSAVRLLISVADNAYNNISTNTYLSAAAAATTYKHTGVSAAAAVAC